MAKDLISEFVGAISTDTAEPNTTYNAIVSRVDADGTVWVSVEGSSHETPTASVSSEVKSGDAVKVEWSNNRLYIAGNISNPAAGVSRVINVEQAAQIANQAAQNAVVDAGIARQAAETAQAIVTDLEESVESLEGRVDTAEGKITTIEGDITQLESDVSTAQGNITTIQGNITTLQSDVTTMQGDVTDIKDDISDLESDVSTAQGDITTIQGNITTLQQDVADAQDDIDDAIEGLALAENVIGTLNWLTVHSTVTDDTTPVSGKSYYIKHQDGTFEIVTDTTGKNPHQQGWYEMDSAISNYVGAHLALTEYGLNLTLDNNSYRIHIGTLTASGDDGVYVIDGDGNVVTYFGESISFDSDYPFHIGNQNNYILWNPTLNRIEIGGDVMMGGSKTLDEVLADIDGAFIFDTSYEVTNGVAYLQAHVYRGGVDIRSEYDESQFTWYLKTEDGEQQIIPAGRQDNTGYTTQVSLSECGYGAEVITHFTTTSDSPLLDSNDNSLTDDSNTPLTARTASGDSVRVRDLTSSSTIYATDKLMVVGTEDEHLVTMQTLQDYLNVNLNKQVLFNTTAAWDAQVQLQSQPNTIYVYTDHQMDSQGNLVAGIKVGDGNAYLVDMPFTDAVIMEHMSNNVIHITAEERAFWNNKVSCYLADNDRVIFTTA